MSQDGAQAHGTGRSVGRGRYQLRDLLGTGGMAAVHLAYDSVLDREVAIKTLHTELGREQAFRERFRREAQAVAKLSHTNIVSVYDSGEDELDGGTTPYIVMEYVSGQPLRDALDADIAQYGAMPTEKALKITADVLAALETSHEMGLVHRDIKPGNVMVTKRGVVKVMDFGIARAMQSGVTSMTQTGMVVGTPQYLSPEQALGRSVDARSDLYSVGIMLFELLTGQLPFDADSPLAIAYAHVQEEPPAPSSINRSLPPAVDAIVARALKKNPNERFPTAQAMQDECLRIAQSGQSGSSPVIIGGQGPRSSGASVASAVFPSATGSPATGAPNVQNPYTPPPANGQYGYPPSTPPPPSHGYPTPAPGPYHGGMQTPPPYTISPQSGGPGTGGGKSNKPVLIGSAAVALIAVVAVVLVIALSGGDPEQPGPQANGTAQPSASATEDTDDKVQPEQKDRTIDPKACTEAVKSYDDKSKVMMPNFYSKNLTSVKNCMQQAGWQWDITYENSEPMWGKNAVIRQTPAENESFDPKGDDEIELVVSTGKSG
ncbi:protein kinase domain-containing protein [Streptomyces purpurogeneiscleroticus]|uniref:protein kinase domain-containing protein n=1 Tax=Streptomyces purpurogeneiscleroticus TaxID=68259 RepID=UPI001CBEF44D|nr:protein kinase [Streptomyces purpurogeneiscleroticus]MBZ4016528.1 serine/threonine protein kinase [Streptomyces purpurogeneiscleroticus]